MKRQDEKRNYNNSVNDTFWKEGGREVVWDERGLQIEVVVDRKAQSGRQQQNLKVNKEVCTGDICWYKVLDVNFSSFM